MLSKASLKDKRLPKEYWKTLGNFKKRFLVFYEGSVLDLTDFMAIHPGGAKAITNYKNKDITKLIFTVFPHPKTIIKTLMKYEVGRTDGGEQASQEQMRSLGKSQKSSLRSTSSVGKSKKRVSIVFDIDDTEEDCKSKCSIGNSSKRVVFASRTGKERHQTRRKTFFYHDFENAIRKKNPNLVEDSFDEESESDQEELIQRIPMFPSKFFDQAQ